jgi:hypothetical protein
VSSTEANPLDEAQARLPVAERRDWNHRTVKTNSVLNITRASLSLVHEALASAVLSSSRVDRATLAHRGGDMKDTPSLAHISLHRDAATQQNAAYE